MLPCLAWQFCRSLVILTTRRTHLHLTSERIQVSRLQIHRARSLKLTGQTFTRTESRNDTTRGNALNLVLAVPSNKMTIVDEVCLTILELESINPYQHGIQRIFSVKLTSFLIIAPKLCIQSNPVPEIL